MSLKLDLPEEIVMANMAKEASTLPDFGSLLKDIPAPCYVLDEKRLIENGKRFEMIAKETGANFILALKAFSTFSVFPILQPFLKGTTASSCNEYRLATEEFGKEVHVYSPAYTFSDFDAYCQEATHLTFNSIAQYRRFEKYKNLSKLKTSFGLRLNPEYTKVRTELYNPCGRYSRFGVTAEELQNQNLKDIEGYHFHILCGGGSEDLYDAMRVIEEKFGHLFYDAKWVNMGGGHYITHPNYNVDLLMSLIKDFKKKYDVEVYFEPGEAIVLKAGYLVSSVVDMHYNEKEMVILDTSATAHMPDVLEMPYQPDVLYASKNPEELNFSYRLGGNTCLSGDVMGDYSFEDRLKIGDKLVFMDMAQYTMVKNTTFNGIDLPSIGLIDKSGKFKLLKTFGYNDFKSRLG